MLYIRGTILPYILVSKNCQVVRRFPERGTRIKIPPPFVCVCRFTSGRVLMRTIREKEKTCYYPYHPSTQEDSEEHLTPKRFRSRPPSKEEDLSPSRYLWQYGMFLLISSLILTLLWDLLNLLLTTYYFVRKVFIIININLKYLLVQETYVKL